MFLTEKVIVPVGYFRRGGTRKGWFRLTDFEKTKSKRCEKLAGNWIKKGRRCLTKGHCLPVFDRVDHDQCGWRVYRTVFGVAGVIGSQIICTDTSAPVGDLTVILLLSGGWHDIWDLSGY